MGATKTSVGADRSLRMKPMTRNRDLSDYKDAYDTQRLTSERLNLTFRFPHHNCTARRTAGFAAHEQPTREPDWAGTLFCLPICRQSKSTHINIRLCADRPRHPRGRLHRLRHRRNHLPLRHGISRCRFGYIRTARFIPRRYQLEGVAWRNRPPSRDRRTCRAKYWANNSSLPRWNKQSS